MGEWSVLMSDVAAALPDGFGQFLVRPKEEGWQFEGRSLDVSYPMQGGSYPELRIDGLAPIFIQVVRGHGQTWEIDEFHIYTVDYYSFDLTGGYKKSKRPIVTKSLAEALYYAEVAAGELERYELERVHQIEELEAEELRRLELMDEPVDIETAGKKPAVEKKPAMDEMLYRAYNDLPYCGADARAVARALIALVLYLSERDSSVLDWGIID